MSDPIGKKMLSNIPINSKRNAQTLYPLFLNLAIGSSKRIKKTEPRFNMVPNRNGSPTKKMVHDNVEKPSQSNFLHSQCAI